MCQIHSAVMFLVTTLIKATENNLKIIEYCICVVTKPQLGKPLYLFIWQQKVSLQPNNLVGSNFQSVGTNVRSR